MIYVVNPLPGATSTNSSSSLLVSFNILTCTKLPNELRRGQEMCAPYQILLPRVDIGIDPYTVFYNHLHLALQVSHSVHKSK
jgi:hypothetical protein